MKRKTDADTGAGRLHLVKIKTASQRLRTFTHAQHAKVARPVKLIDMANSIVDHFDLQALG